MTDNLHSLLIYCEGLNGPLQMRFKNKVRAEDYAEKLNSNDPESLILYDDYGQTVNINRPVIATTIADLEQEFKAEGDVAILRARAQMEAQKKAQTDPKLNQRTPIIAANFPAGRTQ